MGILNKLKLNRTNYSAVWQLSSCKYVETQNLLPVRFIDPEYDTVGACFVHLQFASDFRLRSKSSPVSFAENNPLARRTKLTINTKSAGT